ncbi:thioredoxin family protein [Luteolibacter yonseiensis]|uniref:Thioredoxin family protein n=1 Tax=Luteolibacter yonseiensis TaxID=1144680 RepID=A0A934RAJ8_9BACT|nr:thioredoxin family protein [Luteolibacter yonseiensis]MBK1818185.1 thioredoxin family protein [Luteolibacter yonseiensis]
MKLLPLWTLIPAIALVSCGGAGKIEQREKQENPINPATKRPLIRSGSSDSGTPVAPGGNIAAGGAKPDLSIFPSADEIAYTNPDDPEAGVPELGDLLLAPKRGPWEESETIAKQRAMREGKPLLIWFTDSQTSPMCKALSQELFSTNDFGNWATENIVRLKVDSFVSKEDVQDMKSEEADDYRARVKEYNIRLKKRYKIMGYPSLVMVSPNGEVVGRYRGYKRGDSTFLFGQFKHSAEVSVQSIKGWHGSLEKKGYREWQDRKGRKIFAKLTSYSSGSGVLNFIEPDGTRSRTTESKLSDEDRAWINEQKKLRNLE